MSYGNQVDLGSSIHARGNLLQAMNANPMAVLGLISQLQSRVKELEAGGGTDYLKRLKPIIDAFESEVMEIAGHGEYKRSERIQKTRGRIRTLRGKLSKMFGTLKTEEGVE